MKFTDLVPRGIFVGAQGEDALSLLTADHDRVQELFRRFGEIKDVTDAKSMGQKERIAAAACGELTVHAKLEEEIFYPAVRAAIEDDELINEAQVEHDGAKALIAQLGHMTVRNEMFNAKFTVLAEYVNHHIREEQLAIFPKVRLAGLDLLVLGQRMAARKRELTERTHSARRRPPPKKRTAAQRKPATRRHAASAKL